MSPQELQALENFLAQLTQARAGAKDPQAEARILEAAARQPDAAYLLVQRAMLLDHALASAQAQIATLQNQLQAAQAGRNTSFMDPASNWGNHVTGTGAAPNPGYTPQQAAPMQMPAQPQPAPAQPVRSGFFSGGLGSTLGSVATTAAGVAGGALLFQGIENLFHHNSGSGGFFGQQPVMGGTTETVINNYYGSGSGSDSSTTAARDDSLGLMDDSDLGGGDYSDDDSLLS